MDKTLKQRAAEIVRDHRRMADANDASPVRWSEMPAFVADLVTLGAAWSGPAPVTVAEGKAVLTEWREDGSQWARYVEGRPCVSLCDEAAQVQQHYFDRYRFAWHVYDRFGDGVEPIESGEERSLVDAQRAADDWIRANPDRVPFRLPASPASPRRCGVRTKDGGDSK